MTIAMRRFLRMMAVVLWVANAQPSAQRNPLVPRASLPLGLGIGVVMPQPGTVLHFYQPPGVDQQPGDYPPADTVRFVAGLPSVEIAEAPPWLAPEHLKMDYEIFHLRVITLGKRWAEVIGNMRTGETWWVDRSQLEFVGWPEFLLDAAGVEAFDAETNPVRARPHDGAPIMSTARAALPVLSVQGEWLKVTTSHLADRMPPEGWIRWRRGQRLLVSYSPLS